MNVAKIWCFGQGEGLFAHVESVDDDMMPVMIIILYLSRLERHASTYLRRIIGI